MNRKSIILLSSFFGFVGGYIPTLFGVNTFSGWSLLGAFVGGVMGVIVGYKYLDL